MNTSVGNTKGPMTKSNMSLYWKIWVGLVGCLLLLRFTVFLHADKDLCFDLFTYYMMPSWIAVMIINVIEGGKIMSYLKANHPDTWNNLTYVPGIGSGGRNGFRQMAFIRSDDDLGTPS